MANVSQVSDHPVANLDMSAQDTVMGVLPFYHIYGMVVVMLSALRVGATVVSGQ